MARNVRTTFLYVLVLIAFLASISHRLFRDFISGEEFRPPSVPLKGPQPNLANHAIHENLTHQTIPHLTGHDVFSSLSSSSSSISTVSILLPGWEVLVILSPETTLPQAIVPLDLTHIPASQTNYNSISKTTLLSPSLFLSLSNNMARNVRTTFLYVLVLIAFLASISHRLFRDFISGEEFRPPSVPLKGPQPNLANHAIHENLTHQTIPHLTGHDVFSSLSSSSSSISTVSILLPGWEVLVILSPETTLPSDINEFTCLFPNNVYSPAKPAGELYFPNRTIFTCELPKRVRRRLPFRQPILTKSKESPLEIKSPAPELLRWNHVVYDSLTTEDDVVVFVKGLNNRQGSDRDPKGFKCVFGDDEINGVRTAVTSSVQEVFRCQRPDLTALSPSGEKRIKVSIENSDVNLVLPSLAYYTPARKVAVKDEKSLLCACTMVYNVAKFLKEWVIYHSKIGVDKFILYDNDSDDDLKEVVEELVQEGYDLNTWLWFWPKTQEAGFSHCALYAKNSCTWMTFIDVDEFIYSPSWSNYSSKPSKSMLQSYLQMPKSYSNNRNGGELSLSSSSSSLLVPSSKPLIGQFIIGCHEFGPSNQLSNPISGVMQGYNCRRKMENRHKSIVLLEAVHDSLLNVIHHFRLKEGYRTRKISIQEMVVNHYKFQAWPEFKAKFRRRVSAYVVDWTLRTNLNSNDRTPGLGYTPLEPQGWPQKFCQVYDNGLKELAQRWFGG
ncbi:unnamed protein product [Ilex paraguariensis]|uniref:Glycosyltransferase family 92 protein n=1 Tax=Ilex paraguariensis TaxID=185542 RepID=A0ABC8U976_9AQUA